MTSNRRNSARSWPRYGGGTEESRQPPCRSTGNNSTPRISGTFGVSRLRRGGKGEAMEHLALEDPAAASLVRLPPVINYRDQTSRRFQPVRHRRHCAHDLHPRHSRSDASRRARSPEKTAGVAGICPRVCQDPLRSILVRALLGNSLSDRPLPSDRRRLGLDPGIQPRRRAGRREGLTQPPCPIARPRANPHALRTRSNEPTCQSGRRRFGAEISAPRRRSRESSKRTHGRRA
jgi:hypothetical protein